MNISYKKLSSFEKKDFANHLKRLDDEDRFCRFEVYTPDEFIEEYVRNISLFKNDTIFGAFDDRLKIRGAIHISFKEDNAEFGLSVEKEWRGNGIGKYLFQRAISYSRLMGSKKLECIFFRKNHWMMKNAKNNGFIIEDFQEPRAVLELDKCDLETYQKEFFEERNGAIFHFMKSFLNINKSLLGDLNENI